MARVDAAILERQRKAKLAGRAVLSAADEAVARAEATDLWQALSADDSAGRVTQHMKENPERARGYTGALTNAEKPALADIMGSQWTQDTPMSAPRLARSVFPALVVFNVVDVYLAYRQGGKWATFYAVADPLAVTRSMFPQGRCGAPCPTA